MFHKGQPKIALNSIKPTTIREQQRRELIKLPMKNAGPEFCQTLIIPKDENVEIEFVKLVPIIKDHHSP